MSVFSSRRDGILDFWLQPEHISPILEALINHTALFSCRDSGGINTRPVAIQHSPIFSGCCTPPNHIFPKGRLYAFQMVFYTLVCLDMPLYHRCSTIHTRGQLELCLHLQVGMLCELWSDGGVLGTCRSTGKNAWRNWGWTGLCTRANTWLKPALPPGPRRGYE